MADEAEVDGLVTVILISIGILVGMCCGWIHIAGLNLVNRMKMLFSLCAVTFGIAGQLLFLMLLLDAAQQKSPVTWQDIAPFSLYNSSRWPRMWSTSDIFRSADVDHLQSSHSGHLSPLNSMCFMTTRDWHV